MGTLSRVGSIMAAFIPAVTMIKTSGPIAKKYLKRGTKVDFWNYKNRSKHKPHQGKQECARRMNQGHHEEMVYLRPLYGQTDNDFEMIVAAWWRSGRRFTGQKRVAI